MEVEPKPFILVFKDDEKLEIPKQVLKYIGVWHSFYEEENIHEFSQAEGHTLRRVLWEEIFRLLKEHDDLYDEDDEDEGRQILDPRSLDVFNALEQEEVYAVIRAMDFYDVPLLLVAMLKEAMKRLLAMSETQLYMAHRDVKRRTPSGVFVPNSAKEAILPDFSKRLVIMEEIFRHYIRVESLIQLIQTRFIPRADHLVAVGEYHSLVITEKGVYSAGMNYHGELGRNTTMSDGSVFQLVRLPEIISVFTTEFDIYFLGSRGELFATVPDPQEQSVNQDMPPRKIDLDFVISMAAGDNHVVALTANGVYAWGSNSHGQLGNGTTISNATPNRININVPIVAVATAFLTTFLVSENGDLYHCGRILGTDNEKNLEPVKLALPGPVAQIASSWMSAFVLLVDGSVYSWGDNAYGNLGLGDTVARVEPTRITFFDNHKITRLIGGFLYSLFLGEKIYMTGRNEEGLLLDTKDRLDLLEPTPLNIDNDDIIDLGAANHHMIILKSDGLYGLGRNSENQLGSSQLPRYVDEPTRLPLLVGHEKYHFNKVGEEVKKRRTTTTSTGVSCHLCGSTSTPLHLHRPSQKLFCNSQCLNRYQ